MLRNCYHVQKGIISFPTLYSTTVSVYPAQSQHCCRMLFVLFVSDVICMYWFVMYQSASLYTGNQQSRECPNIGGEAMEPHAQ